MARRARLFVALAVVAGCSGAVTAAPIVGGDAGPEGNEASTGTDATSADAPASLDDGASSFEGSTSDGPSDGGLHLPDVMVPDLDCSAPPTVGATVDLSGPAIFWTECNVLRASALDGTGKVTIATGSVPTGVAIDPIALKLYWADNGTDAITRSDLDGGAREIIYSNADPFSNPNGIAVDHDANKIFWTEGSVIKTAALDGTSPSTLYTGMFPTGVTTAPSTSELFFTDNGTDGVHHGTYAGAAAVLLYVAPKNTDNPAAVAFDEQQGQVFWAQAGGIYRMFTDGGMPTKISAAGFSGGIGLDPSMQRLYFSDNATDTLTGINYDGTLPLVIHHNTNAYSNPRGVVVHR